MKKILNPGFEPATIADYRAKMKEKNMLFWAVEEEGNSDEYFHFYFIGKYKDQEIIYDAAIYTLRLEHESELYEIAERKAALHFPGYKKIIYEEDENGDLRELDDIQEEIGLYMAEVILELQEEDQVKVQEHVEINDDAEFGIRLDVGLHVDKITPLVLERFIKNFNEDKLQLDETLYTFQAEEEEQ